MSIATQTFGLPMRHNVRHGASFTSIGARLWLSLIASVKAKLAARAAAHGEQELLALAKYYEASMPSFAAELRAANCRRS